MCGISNHFSKNCYEINSNFTLWTNTVWIHFEFYSVNYNLWFENILNLVSELVDITRKYVFQCIDNDLSLTYVLIFLCSNLNRFVTYQTTISQYIKNKHEIYLHQILYWNSMEQKVKSNQKYFYKINMYCTDKIYEYEENFLLLADFTLRYLMQLVSLNIIFLINA